MKYGSCSAASLPVSAKPSQARSRAKDALLDVQSQERSDNIGKRELRPARCRAGHLPALLECPVEALLAVEVVGDQLLVDAGPTGNRADASAGETMLPELDQRSFKNALASALGVALALLSHGETGEADSQ